MNATIPRSMVFVIISLAALQLCVLACGDSGNGKSGSSDSDPVRGDGDHFGSGPDPSPDPTGNPTSYDVIDAALAAATITIEQALLYKLYVEVDDPALPPAFRGDDTGLIEGDAERQVVEYIDRVGLANVPEATLDAFWPYFVPAYYEGSWWDRMNPDPAPAHSARAARSQSNGVAAAASRNCRRFDNPWEVQCTPLDTWDNVGGTNVVVWYERSREAVDAPRANMLVQEFDGTIWPELTKLMGRTPISDVGTGISSETDPRLDVILIDMPGNKEGRTPPSTLIGCKVLPAHIYLNRNLSHQGLIANGAHEFMHVLQFTYPVAAQCVTDYHTTIEATAVWATHHVYPKNDWEHKYPDHYLTKQWVSFAYDDRNASKEFRYGAYLLPLFLESRFGPSIVKQIWDRTLSATEELAAIDGALLARGSTFEREWPRFIAANWNRDLPNTYLKDDDLDLRQADPREDFVMTMNSSGIASHPHNVALPHASSAYYRVTFGDSASRSVMIVNGLRFKVDSDDLTGDGNSLVFTGLDLFDRSGASMQVYLKVNGVWQSGPVDLTNAMWSSVCRDNPVGKIDEAVFIYGNAEIGTTMPNYPLLAARSRPPGLLVTNVGCRDWTGSLEMTDPLTGGQERLRINNIVFKNAISTAAPTPFPAGTPSGPYPLEPGEEISPLWGWPYTLTSGIGHSSCVLAE